MINKHFYPVLWFYWSEKWVQREWCWWSQVEIECRLPYSRGPCAPPHQDQICKRLWLCTSQKQDWCSLHGEWWQHCHQCWKWWWPTEYSKSWVEGLVCYMCNGGCPYIACRPVHCMLERTLSHFKCLHFLGMPWPDINWDLSWGTLVPMEMGCNGNTMERGDEPVDHSQKKCQKQVPYFTLMMTCRACGSNLGLFPSSLQFICDSFWKVILTIRTQSSCQLKTHEWAEEGRRRKGCSICPSKFLGALFCQILDFSGFRRTLPCPIFPGGLCQSPGDFLESTWSPVAYFFGWEHIQIAVLYPPPWVPADSTGIPWNVGIPFGFCQNGRNIKFPWIPSVIWMEFPWIPSVIWMKFLWIPSGIWMEFLSHVT